MLLCDTSTLAKYYVREAESEAVRERLHGEDAVTLSDLARAEIMAVFHRRLRERKWTQDDFLAVVRQFSHDDTAGYWTWLPLNREIVDRAASTYATLPDTVFLRTADCLHLVTALVHGFTEICTHDRHQIEAAPALGITATRIS